MKKFEGVQADILNASKKNQLVSAGAGSGKTTVMIEKISNLLLQNQTEIDNLLVVTFTVLAAGEMKERLIKKLKDEIENSTPENKERILKLIEKIDTANIDTIDGFASKTIKKYFYDLEINPNIEIVSEATKDYYLTKAMKKTFNENLIGDDVNFMLDLFGGNKRNLDTLEEMVLTNYYHIINIEDYEKFLDDCVKEYEDSVKSENVINNHICEMGARALRLIIEEFSTFTQKVQDKFKPLLEVLNQLNRNLSFKTNIQIFNKLEKIRFSGYDYKDNPSLKSLKIKINNIFDLKDDIEENNINENYEENNKKIIKYLNIFINLLKNFIKNYNSIKKNNNLIDFNDLNRLMLKLLKNENIKKELQNKYKYIFIDEYQDVNPLQDGLINQLAGEDTTIFMVGDVKQSIYGFRGSSPEWFLTKYEKMKKDVQNEDVFDMNINFRSSPTILKFINEIFNVLMTKEIADIDYKKDCEIEPKRDDIVDDKVKILLVKEDDDVYEKGLYSVKNHEQKTTYSANDKESMWVAKIITELIDTEFYDANKKERRKLKYSDIAILTHSDKDESSVNLINLLKQKAIPLNRNNKLDVKESEIVKLVLSILKCVVGTADDVDYLSTFLSLTNLTLDDVVQIRDKNFSFYENLLIIKQNLVQNDIFFKISEGFNIIDEIRFASNTKTNRELILYILNEKKLKYYILQKPNGEQELNLLEEFLNKLSPIEDSLGLAEFIEVVESNVSSSGDFSSVDKEDSVTIQTIHKSKGLEYPVVILFNSSKLFSYVREHDAINFNSNLGFGFDYFDVLDRTKVDSLPKFAIKVENHKKGYKEELRLLYVALTRAKNKLFITGSIGKNNFEEMKKTSYTNMLLSCFADRMQDDYFESENFVCEIVEDLPLTDKKLQTNQENVDVCGLEFEYQHKEKFSIPFKNSVTGINSENAQSYKYELTNVINKSTQYEVEDRAQIGVDYHKALELLDLTRVYEKNSDIKSIDYNKIKLAHEKLSPLVDNAIDIRKEAEFMMYVPYNTVNLNSAIEDKILIQGVVDLIIEKEKTITLVDYKFSNLPAKVLKEKYSEQLNLYKYAIEEAYQKPVEHMFIYSINSGELI